MRVQGGHWIADVPYQGGTAPLCHLSGVGAPTAQTLPSYTQSLNPNALGGPAPTVDVQQVNVANCAIGSLWSDTAGGHLWNKTAMPSAGNPVGTWNQIV
jgi:hypothetical protein